MAIRCPGCRYLIDADPPPGSSIRCAQCGRDVSARDRERQGESLSGDATKTPTWLTPTGPGGDEEDQAPPRIPGYEFEGIIGRGGIVLP